MFNKLTWCFIFIMFLTAVVSGQDKTYKLADFEDSISNEFWLEMKTTKDDCRVAETSISQNFKSNGANSLKVVFTKHKRGAKPYVIFEPNIDNRALCINDWAPYRRLLIDVYNPMKKKTGLRMLISDPAFKRNFWNKYSFKPGWNTIIIPISDLAKRGLNLAKITKLKFYTPRPREDIVLYFDNFRFSKESGSPWASAASALSSSIVKMESLNKTLSAGVNKAKLIENNIKSQKGKYDDLLNEMKLIRNNICDKSIFAVASTGIPESQCTGIKQTGLSYARGIEITNLEYFSDKLKNILAEKKLLEQITENKSNADFVIGEIKYPDVDNIRYSPRTYSGSLINTVSVSACKNETRSACLLVIPHQKALKNLQLKAKELKSRSFKSVIPANNIKICPVAYRKDNFQNAAFAYLLRPDIAKVDIPVNAQQAFWLNIKVPDNIPAGNYSGQIVVSADGIKPQNIGINLHVYNFTLPAKPSLPVIVHSNSSPTVAADALDIMEHRCEPGSIYTWRNVPTIERIKLWVKNGAQMIPLLRISTQGRNIWKRDANGKVIDFADSRKAAILRKLRAIIPKIKKAGLLDKCYVYGFDEPSPAWLPAMEKVYSELKKEFGIKTMFATYQPLWEYQDIKNADYWAVAWGLLTPERIKRFHKKNIKLFSYNLATQGQRGKLQFWSAFKSGVDGLLHYKLNSANDEAPKTDFPIVNAKLGSVRMPDRAGKKNYNTISFEMWREGSEDYEYLYLLRKNIKLLEKNPTLAKNNAELLFKAKATLFSVNETIPSIDKYYSSYNDISLNTICELRNRVAKIIEKLEYVLNNKNQE